MEAYQELSTIKRVLGDDNLSQMEKLVMIAYIIHPNSDNEQIAREASINGDELVQVKHSLMRKDWLASPAG